MAANIGRSNTMTEEEMKLQEHIIKKRAVQRMNSMKGAWKRESERIRFPADGPRPAEREQLRSVDD